MTFCFCKKEGGPAKVSLYVETLEKQVRALQSQVISLQIQVSSKQARIESLERSKWNEIQRRDEASNPSS